MARLAAWVWLVGCSTLFLGAGCTVPSLKLPSVSPTSSFGSVNVATPAIGWVEYGPGVARLKTSFATSTASDLILYRFSLKDYRFQFEHASSGAAISEWAAQYKGVVFLSNGVYFHEDQLPSGWLKTRGTVVGKRAFDTGKSALLELAPEPNILSGMHVSTRMKMAREAAQSYPLLVLNGKAAVEEESGKVNRRTFVGVDRERAFLYVGIVPYAGISLYELSRVLVTLPIAWGSVINLDGGSSSGIVFQSGIRSELIDSYVTVPNVLTVRRIVP